MEKKQKIVMKKLQFVIIIALGSNCQSVIIRGQYSIPRWEMSRGILQAAIVLGGNCLGAIIQGEVVRGAIIRGRDDCPEGNCPRT